MKKRILSSLLVGVMTTVVLVGCGDAPNSTEKMTNSQSFGDNCVETSTTSDASADNVSNDELSEADGLVKYSTQVYTPEYSTEENVVYDKKICGTSVVSDDKQSFDLIILDDVTSALDAITTKQVLLNLEKLNDKAKIIVSQKISAIKNCDKILVIENGKNCGYGTHEELLNSNKAYREIYESQLMKEGDNQ